MKGLHDVVKARYVQYYGPALCVFMEPAALPRTKPESPPSVGPLVHLYPLPPQIKRHHVIYQGKSSRTELS